ncbi:hypothetical protein pdam_00025082 [Pocillopora damicornis]|uniref:Uncharacterized protein n=1 Tax=Pocillopora damicornis TaxID=46731 RepID=A0A3M6TBW8_POCDA|nr:hypothetical protein pdam_00025082 [Pocillopora damicornis]
MKTLVRQSRTKCSKKNYWMVTEVMENYRNREVGQSPLVLSKVPAHNYLKTRMCRSKPVGITHAKGSRFYFGIDMIMFSKQEL